MPDHKYFQSTPYNPLFKRTKNGCIPQKRGRTIIHTIADIAAANYRRDLGNGLVARWSTAADSQNIAQLVSLVFREKEQDPPNQFLHAMTSQLMSDQHPLMGSGDYAIVEDTQKEGNPIVAGICFQRMEWDYEGIPFLMARPEIVATDATYRNRGLIRHLFEFIHARSESEGRLIEGITGISYFYRQFGYEYALDLDGHRSIYLASIPKAAEGETDAYTIREASIKDLPRLKELYDQQRATYMISTHMDEKHIRWLLEGWKENPEQAKLFTAQAILDSNGQVQGWFEMATQRRWSSVNIGTMCINRQLNLQAMLPSILHALQRIGPLLPIEKPETEPFTSLKFNLGTHHPFYDALGNIVNSPEPTYAWYIRVSDLPRFIRHIAPALEQRLINSPVANYTGELKIDFYRGGLRLVFDKGRLTHAENWRATVMNYNADAGFPPLVFLKALFGYRSLAELRHAYPDAWANNAILFNTLFPAKPSWGIPL